MAFHRFLKAILKDEEIQVYGDGQQTRDFTFVADVVAATRAAGERGKPGGVYNIGGGHRVTLLEVIETIEQVTGRKARLKRFDGMKGDVRHTWADTGRARNDLGFAPATELREGLAEECTWIRDVFGM